MTGIKSSLQEPRRSNSSAEHGTAGWVHNRWVRFYYTKDQLKERISGFFSALPKWHRSPRTLFKRTQRACESLFFDTFESHPIIREVSYGGRYNFSLHVEHLNLRMATRRPCPSERRSAGAIPARYSEISQKTSREGRFDAGFGFGCRISTCCS